MVVDATGTAIAAQGVIVVGHQLRVLGQLHIDLHAVQTLFQCSRKSFSAVHGVWCIGSQATMTDEEDPGGIGFAARRHQADKR
jgi:hypothetical protein